MNMTIFKAKYLLLFALVSAVACSAFLLVNREVFFCERMNGGFVSVDSYREVQPLFDSCDAQTLVTFDVDDTLIADTDVMARDLKFSTWFQIRAVLRHPSLALKARQEWFASIIFQQAERLVFDQDIVRIIKQLREQGCTVVALTAIESGPFGVIDNMPKWRADMLQRLGMDFRGPFQDVIFDEFPEHNRNYPCLYRGILCANKQPKGLVLAAFLDRYHLKPARIVSFDDGACALASIAQVCEQRGIAFTGYQCLGAKKLPGSWCDDRAFVQLDYVMKYGRWLNDKQADAIVAGEKLA